MKSRFLSALVLIHVSDSLKRLACPLEFESESMGRVITVPTGFETDLGSVPRLPLAYLLFGGVGDAAAVVHDYAYSGKESISREQADNLFREALGALDDASTIDKSGITKAVASGWFSVRRAAMWLGVRVAGAGHYVGAS